jgi:4-alpha-glucanotransferase
VLGLQLQMNLPGTTIQHPNWRIRYPMSTDAMVADPRVGDTAAALSRRST